VPLGVSLLVPVAVGFASGFSGAAQRVWIHGAGWVGISLSVVLGIVGLALVVRLVNRRAAWGWPLGASVVLASSPFLLVAVSSGLLWLMGRIL
jgi:hypothetical protein